MKHGDSIVETAELNRVCMNCNHGFPAELPESEYGICLHDPEFAPYLDDLLDRQDFSRCQDLVKRKRFEWEQEACKDFEPMQSIKTSREFDKAINRLEKAGNLTLDSLEQAVLQEAVRKIDWKTMPADQYVERFKNAKTAEERKKAVRSIGALIAHDNKAAFDTLCEILRNLTPPHTLEQSHFKSELLTEIGHTRRYRKKLARLLVEDLFRTPSNNQTRGWYTDVFGFFERTAPELAEEALSPMLESPQFSYRIKRRVRGIIEMQEFMR